MAKFTPGTTQLGKLVGKLCQLTLEHPDLLEIGNIHQALALLERAARANESEERATRIDREG